MDDRQTDIKAGAGLEDSRINKEFIDFLNKWSSPVIMVIAVAALVWAGLGWMEQKKIEKLDQAFGELQAATMGGNPSPASLNALAETFAGVRAVPEIAKLTTTDLYLSAYLQGVQPGAQLDQFTGEPINEADKLDENQRQLYLDQAGTLAQEVIALSESDEGKALLTMHGLIRAGSVAECKRDFDGAKAYYARVISLADQVQIPSLSAFGQMRIDALDTFNQDMTLPSKNDLVALPGEEIPDLPELPVIPESEDAPSADSQEPASDQPEADQP